MRPARENAGRPAKAFTAASDERSIRSGPTAPVALTTPFPPEAVAAARAATVAPVTRTPIRLADDDLDGTARARGPALGTLEADAQRDGPGAPRRNARPETPFLGRARATAAQREPDRSCTVHVPAGFGASLRITARITIAPRP